MSDLYAQGTSRWRGSNQQVMLSALFAILSTLLISLTALASQAHAAVNPSLYATNLTSPTGIWIPDKTAQGGHFWVSDHLRGFCRLDPAPAGSPAPFEFGSGQGACIPTTVIPSAGAASFDPNHTDAFGRPFIYVSDNTAKSKGVYRLTFDPNTAQVGLPTLLVPTQGLGGNVPWATALDKNGNLYVSFKKNGNIYRIAQPYSGSGNTSLSGNVGQSSNGRRVLSIAMAGDDLYLAEKGTLSAIKNISTIAANKPQTAVDAGYIDPLTGVPFQPTAVGYDTLKNRLYFADTPGALSTVYQVDLSVDPASLFPSTPIEYATTSADGQSLRNVSSLSVDPLSNVFIGDDTTGGLTPGTGHIYEGAAQ